MAITITRTAPPATPTGVTATAVNGYDKCYNMESGTLTDRTTEFITVGTDVDSFAAQNDYVYFSQIYHTYGTDRESRISKLHIVLSTFASASITPTFEYNTGNNTWATLAVTDGTAGFTQDGTITVTPATMPTMTAWKIGSQDGSGNEIGDGVDRRYIRIKRTASSLATPPQISESGVGYLTASTTYYYKIASMAYDGVMANAYNNWMRSVPCAEVSATTTAVKRSIQIDWTSTPTYPTRQVWRTPVSGDYTGASRPEYRADLMDTDAQAVNANYFNPLCADSDTRTYTVDNGLCMNFSYNSTYTYLGNFLNNWYRDYARGLITVSGGDASTKASFEDIYLADVAGGWNTFTKTLQGVNAFRNEIYTCHDNLKIDNYFNDSFFYFFSDSCVKIVSTATATFGTRGTSYGEVYGGGSFVFQGQRMDQNVAWDFYNSKFYASHFVQSSYYQGNTYASFPRFYDSCELYDCVIEGVGVLEACSFNGTNIIMDGLMLYQPRYGLIVASTAASTLSAKRLIIMNGGNAAIYGNWSSGTNITFRDFELRNNTVVLIQYSTSDPTITVNFVNLVIKAAATGQLDKAKIGPNWTIYDKYEFNLKVVDSTGTAISGATVTITDAEGTLLSTLTTNATGDITQQDVSYRKYRPGTLFSATYHQYYPDVITEYSPHTVVISKAGYKTKTVKYTVNRKMTEVETLEKQIPTYNLISGDNVKQVLNAYPTSPQNNVLLDVIDED